MTRNLFGAAALAAVALVGFAREAEAVPLFARATGLGCPACHESWPQLSDTGELFRDRGYQVRGGAEEPTERSLDYFPLTVRTTLGYGYVSSGTSGDKVGSGSFGDPEADVIFGINFARHYAANLVISGFGAEGTANLESAWGRINDVGGSPWLNLRVGRHELDLPLSEHRGYSLTMDYLIYHFHPNGSGVGFAIGDNQLGVELAGHADGPGLRYALSLTSDNGAGKGPLSAPAIYGHVTFTRLMDGFLQRVRAGAFGDLGWQPTTFAMDGPDPIPGTGTDNKRFLQAGVDLHLTLATIARPLLVHAVWLFGSEDQALIENGTRAGTYHGGYLELDWIPTLEMTVFARGDAALNLDQGDDTAPKSAGDQTAITVGARHYVWLSSWGSVAGHGELSILNEDDGAQTTRTTTFLAGLDLAL